MTYISPATPGEKDLMKTRLTILTIAIVFMFSLVLPVAAAPTVTEAVAGPEPGAEQELLQFSSGGHVLGFAPDRVVIASGSHALQLSFPGGAVIAPVAEDAPTADDAAPPLDRVAYEGL